MTAVIIIRIVGNENWAEIVNCNTREEAAEVLESRYYSELYNCKVVYDYMIRDDHGYGRIDDGNETTFFLLLRQEKPCFC